MDERRPSIWTDWRDIKIILDDCRQREEVPTFVETIVTHQEASAEKSFQNSPLLHLMPPLTFGFDGEGAEEVFKEKFYARPAPVHGECKPRVQTGMLVLVG